MSVPDYAIAIQAVVIDGENLFQATVRELPDVAEYGETPEEAYELAKDTIQTTAQIFSEKGRKMPQRWETSDEYSGRVTLRVSKTLHRDIAELADAEGVSLNQQIVNALTYYMGYLFAKKSPDDGFSFVSSRGGVEVEAASAPDNDLSTPASGINLVVESGSVVVQGIPYPDDSLVEVKRTKLHLRVVK